MNPPKLIIDEMLSPSIAVALRVDGVDACHVRDRAMNAASDVKLLERAFREDRIVVTSNVRDFEKLAEKCELHAGLVLVEDADLTRNEQLDVVRSVMRLIDAEQAAGRDMVNRVLRLWPDGQHRFESLPTSTDR